MKTLITTGRAWRLTAALALCLVALTSTPVGAASVVEPATIFYGKVIGTGSEQPFPVTEGPIQWTLLRPDGIQVVLNTVIYPLNGGTYSYRLDIPHEAMALGLTGSTSSIPLTATASTNVNFRITVGGIPARIVPPASDTFTVAQINRASTYRLDLEVPLVAVDSDGDGLPDWWENMYGLDLQNGADALTDADGDGRSNLLEYRNGSDPLKDNRIPELLTSSLRAYAGGSTGLRLASRDIDSISSSLVYTVDSTPGLGRLVLRNGVAGGVNSDVTLTPGSLFTQSDVYSGRLVYVSPESDANAVGTSFEVSLKDEDPAHPAARGVVALTFYRPGVGTESPELAPVAPGLPPILPEIAGLPVDEQFRVEFSWLTRNLGFVVWDNSVESTGIDGKLPSTGFTLATYTNQYIPQYGPDRRHVLWGGSGGDRLQAGMEGDVLIGGPGRDTLRGNGGSDLFVITGIGDGNDLIEDFSVAEHDVLDLTRVLTGASEALTNFVKLTVSGTNTLVGINFSGSGGIYTNMIVTLAGVALGPELGSLVDNGHLRCGNKVLAPRVSILASIPAASENGPVAGEFTLSRIGGVASDLEVNIAVGGSAANGGDYPLILSTITIPAGQSSVRIPVEPFVDSISESREVVQINLLAGPGYAVGTAMAQVSIEDLAPLISIEPLESRAIKSSLTPGAFVVYRGGVLNRSVLVKLNIGGTAANGTDYTGVPTYINLAADQSSAVITVTPKANAVLSHGVESVEVSIKPDAAYCVWTPSSARVLVVDELLTLESWKSRNFGISATDTLTFMLEDPGLTGILNIQRYAFGLDPNVPQSSPGKPSYQLNGKYLSVTFRRPLSVTDVDYTAELSHDLVLWQSGSAYFEEFIHPDFTGRYDMVSYRVKEPLTNSLPTFMRVRLNYNP